MRSSPRPESMTNGRPARKPSRAEDETYRLLRRARKGEEEALEKLFALHRPRLARALRRRFGLSPGDLEDMVQASLMRAFCNLDRFDHRGQGSFLAWLFTTAVHEWQSLVRRERAAKRDARRNEVLVADSRRAPVSDATTPSQRMAAEELEKRIHELIERLPVQQRRAVQLHRLLHLDYAEMQVELGLGSEAAVRALLSRGQARLATLMRAERLPTPDGPTAR